MKPTINQARKKRAFTIVELLTVMSIIVILIGLLVPALNKVKTLRHRTSSSEPSSTASTRPSSCSATSSKGIRIPSCTGPARPAPIAAR